MRLTVFFTLLTILLTQTTQQLFFFQKKKTQHNYFIPQKRTQRASTLHRYRERNKSVCVCVRQKREKVFLCVLSFCSKSIIQLQLDSDCFQLKKKKKHNQKHGIDKQSLIPFRLYFFRYTDFTFSNLLIHGCYSETFLRHVISHADR